MVALENSMHKYEGRREVWLPDVKKLLEESAKGDSAIKQVVKKIRNCMGNYN